MSFAASVLTAEATYLLGDPNNVRWTEAELLEWINDAQEALLAHRPEAFGVEDVHNLEAGSDQTLDSDVVVVFEIPYNTNQT